MTTRSRDTRAVPVERALLPDRFLIVSNRLPYRLQIQAGEVKACRTVGGLTSALEPIFKVIGGTWIGWSGSHEELPATVALDGASADSRLRLINLTPEEVESFYLGYSNQGLWPLFHYFQEHCRFIDEQWVAYQRVNRRFAEAVIREHRDGDFVWIHDYHLMLVPDMVRRELPNARIGFFLHIPFPSAELFLVCPQAPELVAGVLGADLVGFHTGTYARNFISAVRTVAPGWSGKNTGAIRVGDRTVRVGAFPISIAFEDWEEKARSRDVESRIAQIRDYYHADVLALGVDRLDYTKGVLERLRTIEILLEKHPELQGRFTFVQISVPSRTRLRVYAEMRDEIERMVGHINGRFAAGGCVPIDYRYQSYSQDELIAYYRAADVAVVTPLRDGMNLVAKEYVASRIDLSGSLVLSRFAGANEELDGAFVVNPYHAESVSEAICQAINASRDDERSRMRRMRDVVRRNDVYGWLERFLSAAVRARPRSRRGAAATTRAPTRTTGVARDSRGLSRSGHMSGLLRPASAREERLEEPRLGKEGSRS